MVRAAAEPTSRFPPPTEFLDSPIASRLVERDRRPGDTPEVKKRQLETAKTDDGKENDRLRSDPRQRPPREFSIFPGGHGATLIALVRP